MTRPVLSCFSPVVGAQAQALARAIAGTWALPAGRVMVLRPAEPGVLTLAHGRAWVTVGDPRQRAVDHVLQAGDRLAVAAGAQVVVEPWSQTGSGLDPRAGGVAFAWDRMLEAEIDRAPSAWAHHVAQPWGDLARAVTEALGAAGRLAAGLAGLLWVGALGRGTAPPSRGRSSQPCG